MGTTQNDETTEFKPVFDEKGLIPCIVTSAVGQVLMFAWMNREALDLTLETGEAHFWSRSRNELWHKGSTSGETQEVLEIRTDCDQDCLWVTVEMQGAKQAACHTGRRSCFYRVLGKDGKLIFTS
ncbi:MAG: phosphoribosyl-AMP cyclohydrolase [Alphaproteobacteria bacterium PRO2]|nr:phosphoribosyl-AMP cyclohydrolase [Alphaproteobacteria bacterium PRO2]